MSTLRPALEEYLARRRALGCKWHEARRGLPPFVACLAPPGVAYITPPWALRWATQPPHVQPAEWARRRRLGRGCAPYHSAVEPRTEIPPPDALPYRPQRRSPSLYSAAEVAQLIEAAHDLPSPTGLRAHTDAAVFGLLAVTGMRIGALVALDHDDVALRDGRLTIRHAQFGQSRCLPWHPTTRQALWRYVDRRNGIYPIQQSPSFFSSEPGTRLTHGTVRATFIQLSRQLGFRGPSDSHGPRVHDFRHRFAVHSLVRWYREGVEVERHRPELSTDLGQVKVSDTSGYLRATPALLRLATQRLEQAHRRQPS
jgi:integrase/recombinase XerD